MHIRDHALSAPDRPAIVMAGSGRTVSFGELERRSNQAAQLLRACGLGIGDGVAVMLENGPDLLGIAWAAQRAGLYLTCVSTRLTKAEAAYIVQDGGARVLVVSANAPSGLTALLPGVIPFMTGAAAEGFRSWDAETAAFPGTPIADEQAGADMLYSSGTTGQPKGVRRQMPVDGDIGTLSWLDELARGRFGMSPETVYLCPAPLYHAAPLRWSMAAQRMGGTAVIMEKFDAEQALAAIDRYKVTHVQFVPTHFVRLLRLPDECRAAYDTSSLRHVLHAAAPCPVPIKRAMLEWWGPIITEYYSGTEANGMTMITSEEWLERPGSVGLPVIGSVHICDDEGEPLPVGDVGNIYFSGGPGFVYHNDPEKTRLSRNRHGWTTIGDVGRVDEDGYLYLTDRKNFMIISGGVNIYPQEVENLLITHPAIADAAVFGIPDDEMGEMVMAVIQPQRMADAGPELAAHLNEWLRERLSAVKIPRRIEFRADMPREATGKLIKRHLQDEFRAGQPD